MALAQASFDYKGDEKKTKANRIYDEDDRARFFTVGDVGEIDEEGYLFLRDRKIDMIISGGVNIYPAEIEGEFLMHPKVGDVAVFGIPHADWGEAVMAVVEPAEGVEADDRARGGAARVRQGAPGLLQAARHHRVHRRDASDPSGKLYKRKLRDPTGKASNARSEVCQSYWSSRRWAAISSSSPAW